MAMSIIRGVSLGLGSTAIAAEFDNLQEFEKGRIPYLDELISRIKLVLFSKNFLVSALCINPLSKKLNLLALATPLVSFSLKSSYALSYVNPKIISIAARIEKHIGKLCYLSSIITTIALINLGHLIIGYTALAVFGLDIATSFTPILKSSPQICKIRKVFVTFISPFAMLVSGLATVSYLSIFFSILGIYGLLHAENRTKILTQKSSQQIKHSEFIKFLTNLSSKELMHLEMNRERIPLIQIPVLDANQYSPDKVMKFFINTINWDSKDIQKLLYKRVTDIPQDPQEEAFTDFAKDWPRAKEKAVLWLQDVLYTPEKDLILFLQYICKKLLENKALLKNNTQPAQSLKLFKGLLTLIFGSGGQCRVANSMKIKESFLEIYKNCDSTNKEQNDLLLLLELSYKEITEQAFKDILHPILQASITTFTVQAKQKLQQAKKNLNRSRNLRSFSQIPLLVFSTLDYLDASCKLYIGKKLRNLTDLHLVHNFTRMAKIFGKPFNITLDTDEVAERDFSKILMSPLLSSIANIFNSLFSLTLGKFYWDTQLEKLIPLLKRYFESGLLKHNDLLSWLHNFLEGFKLAEKLNPQEIEKINAIQQELQQSSPTINGNIISKPKQIGEKTVFVPTKKTLLIFAYSINLLKNQSPDSPFNGIDKNLQLIEHNATYTPELRNNIKKCLFLLPQNIQGYITRTLEHPSVVLKTELFFNKLQRDLHVYLHKDALFFH